MQHVQVMEMALSSPTHVSVNRLPSSTRPAALRAAAAYLELSKIRLVALVLFTTAVGFVLASPGAIDWPALAWTLLGTALAGVGANALNQWMEADLDAGMQRTRHRPLPSERLTPSQAIAWAVATSVAGPAVLVLAVNPFTAALAVGAQVVYVLIYTPLKTRTSLCTLVGACCGAVPPMIGWAAAAERLAYGAWVLAILLFVWQIPHALTLAWLHRRDYARAGLRILPTVDPSGRAACRAILLYCAALVPLSLTAVLAGIAGASYLIAASALGLGLFALALRLYRLRTRAAARLLFLAALVYLPIVLGVMVIDHHAIQQTHSTPAEVPLQPPA